MMTLRTERLRQLFDLVPRDSVVADVATDHALLPIALVREGKCPRAIASDLRPGPLEFARAPSSLAPPRSLSTPRRRTLRRR